MSTLENGKMAVKMDMVSWTTITNPNMRAPGKRISDMVNAKSHNFSEDILKVNVRKEK